MFQARRNFQIAAPNHDLLLINLLRRKKIREIEYVRETLSASHASLLSRYLEDSSTHYAERTIKGHDRLSMQKFNFILKHISNVTDQFQSTVPDTLVTRLLVTNPKVTIRSGPWQAFFSLVQLMHQSSNGLQLKNITSYLLRKLAERQNYQVIQRLLRERSLFGLFPDHQMMEMLFASATKNLKVFKVEAIRKERKILAKLLAIKVSPLGRKCKITLTNSKRIACVLPRQRRKRHFVVESSESLEKISMLNNILKQHEAKYESFLKYVLFLFHVLPDYRLSTTPDLLQYLETTLSLVPSSLPLAKRVKNALYQ